MFFPATKGTFNNVSCARVALVVSSLSIIRWRSVRYEKIIPAFVSTIPDEPSFLYFFVFKPEMQATVIEYSRIVHRAWPASDYICEIQISIHHRLHINTENVLAIPETLAIFFPGGIWSMSAVYCSDNSGKEAMS